MSEHDEPQRTWVTDGDYEYMVAGPWLLETRKTAHEFRWSAALLMGRVEYGIGSGRVSCRGLARYAAWDAVDKWLRDANAARPSPYVAQQWRTAPEDA